MDGFNNKYPYTDFHELNLDWFLKRFKTVMDEWAEMQEDFHTLETTVADFISYVNNYFNNLDVQQEINNKLDQMAADGTLDAILLPYFNAYKQEVNAIIANQSTRIDGLTSDMHVLSQRMDTFSHLTDGSTTGDAELADIRIAADGETYNTAGDSVRNQIINLTEDYGRYMIVPESSMNTGKYYEVDSTQYIKETTQASSVYTKIDVSAYKGGILRILSSSKATGSRCIAFGEDNNFMQSIFTAADLDSSLNDANMYEADLEITANYLYFSFNSGKDVKLVIISPDVNEKEFEFVERYVGIKENPYQLTGYGLFATDTNRPQLSKRIVCDDNVKSVTCTNTVLDHALYGCYSDGSGFHAITSFTTDTINYYPDGIYKTVFLRFKNATNTVFTEEELQDILENTSVFITQNSIETDQDNKTIYVAANGDDDNPGTKNSPMATVNAAIGKGADTVLMTSGRYEEIINTDNVKTLNIKNISKNGRVTFVNPNAYKIDTEEAVAGYTKVYRSPLSIKLNSNVVWIWQEVPDISTEISDDERHPLERGFQYRCIETKITKATSDTLADATDEIENNSKFKWFYDSINEYLYYSRPEDVTSYPIYFVNTENSLFINTGRDKTINMSGIDVLYMGLNVDETTNSYIADCSSRNAFGNGAYTYDNALNATFINCEASGCNDGTFGDGFNGHSTESGDPHARTTTVNVINAWSHDNNDDGFSDHERCVTSIYGGLFEYNEKAGITPANGDHLICHNALSRNNVNGFMITGTPDASEGGVGSQMYLFNCIADNNNATGSGTGFIARGAGNRVYLVNCKSMNHNSYGYDAHTGTSIVLIDCGTSNNTVVKHGNCIINNTSIVS